jgi:hypothetical protein
VSTSAIPVATRLNAILDLDWDYLNTQDIYPTPTPNLWRYRVGVEADLLGDTGDQTFLLDLLGGVGATTVRSHEFLAREPPALPRTWARRSIRRPLTATGWVRLGPAQRCPMASPGG